MIPSIVTFIAILGCVLRCACRAQSQIPVSNQTSTIIINQLVSDPPTGQSAPEVHEAVAIPIPLSHIEMTTQPSVPLRNEDMVAKIHQEWRNSKESV
jgi:hypothetical protein